MKPSFPLITSGASVLRVPACRFVLGMAVACGASSVAAAVSSPDRHGAIRQSGDLDPAFGTDGRAILSVDEAGGLAAPQSALLPDGKILSVGIISSDTVFLVRMGPEGWPDFDFGQDGAVRVPLGIDGQFSLKDRVVLPDGRLFLAGNVVRPGGSNLLYVRFTPDGRLDPTFGAGGLAEISLPSGGAAQAQHVALLPDGKISAAVRSVRAIGVWDSLLIRLTADGRLDPTFASGGIAVHPFRDSLIRRVNVLADGKLLLSGSYLEYALLSRYHADGRPDETFGTNGHFLLLAPGIRDFNHINDVALQDDGRMVIVGAAGAADQTTSVIARVESDGSGLDPDFNGGVPLLVPSARGISEEEAVVVQTDGKIVSLGKDAMPSTAAARMLRLHADGSFDTGFGQGGIVLTHPTGGAYHLLKHLQIQPDGKYLASGLFQEGGRNSLGVFRFLALPR